MPPAVARGAPPLSCTRGATSARAAPRCSAAAPARCAAPARRTPLTAAPPPCALRAARRRGASGWRRAGDGDAAVGPDPDLLAALNDVSSRAVRAMLSGDAASAAALRVELFRTISELRGAGGDSDTLLFLAALGELLDHRVLPAAEALSGAYARALNAVLAAVEGEWRLAVPGQPDGPPQEPRFATWDEVLNKKKAGAAPSPPPPAPAAAAASDPYALLGVARSATRAELKAAYRAKARAMHPDVNPGVPGADAAFAAVVAAYAALTDGAGGARGEGVDAWAEFQRTPKKESARASARGAPARRAADGAAASDEAEAGDLVEYPLPAALLRGDGRTRGVGLLVARNCDRGDARTLPPAMLDVCEVEPLRQREPGSDAWIPDELLPSVFPRLAQLRRIDRAAVTYAPAHDMWAMAAKLSPGCSGPPHEEEIML